MELLQIKTGYIYFLRSTLLGGYKIGITTSPQARFKALAVGTKAKLLGYWKLDAYRELEKQLHKEYSNERVPQSEWFDLNCSQVREVIQKIASVSQQEFLLPEYLQDFVGPQYKLTKVAPYIAAQRYDFYTFGITVSAFILGYLLATI